MTIKPFYYLYPDYQGIFDLSEFFAEVKIITLNLKDKEFILKEIENQFLYIESKQNCGIIMALLQP